MRAWSTFAEVCGTASASLIGLLFVAVSIRIDLIAPSQELRNRAAQTLSLFATVLIIAILTAVPGQPIQALGAELTTLAIITAGGLIVLDRRAKTHASTQAIARALELLAPTKIVSITLLVSGALLAFGVRDGRYALIIPVLIALTGGVTSAWPISHQDHHGAERPKRETHRNVTKRSSRQPNGQRLLRTSCSSPPPTSTDCPIRDGAVVSPAAATLLLQA